MCPFIVQNSQETLSKKTEYIVVTEALSSDDLIDVVQQKAHALAQQGHKVLLFDGRLGLTRVPDITCNVDVDDVLNHKCAISTLISSCDMYDIITGQGKQNLGAYNECELYQILADLKLLGKNYDTMIIYAPACLPVVQCFFCTHLDSICCLKPDDQHLSNVAVLLKKYPLMKCFLLQDKHVSARALIQASLTIDKTRILSTFL